MLRVRNLKTFRVAEAKIRLMYQIGWAKRSALRFPPQGLNSHQVQFAIKNFKQRLLRRLIATLPRHN
jgi:hypothetical protein